MWDFKISVLTKGGTFLFCSAVRVVLRKEFLGAIVFSFNCSHLPLWRGKVKDPRYMQNKKYPRISLVLFPCTLQLNTTFG